MAFRNSRVTLQRFIGLLYYCIVVMVIFAAIPPVLSAQTISGETVKTTVEHYINRSVPSSVEATIEFVDLKRDYRVSTNDCIVVVSSANSVNMKGLVTFFMKAVYPRYGKGETFTVTARIRTFQNVLVSTQTIQPHCRIELDQIRLVKSESTDLPNPVTDLSQLKNKWTTRWIQNGRALTFDMFEDEPIVKRGDEIMIVVKTKNVIVREQGNAQQDGKMNDVINVINEYRDNLRAKVIGRGEVVLAN